MAGDGSLSMIQMQCNQDASTLKRFIEKDHIYDFLAGLNVGCRKSADFGKEEIPLIE